MRHKLLTGKGENNQLISYHEQQSSGLTLSSPPKSYCETLWVSLEQPDYSKDYSDQAIRLQSFKHWGGVLPAHELAEAGFYMIACHDIVRCHWCNVVLQEWERSGGWKKYIWVFSSTWHFGGSYINTSRPVWSTVVANLPQQWSYSLLVEMILMLSFIQLYRLLW